MDELKRIIYLGYSLFVFSCFAVSAFLQALDAVVIRSNSYCLHKMSITILFVGLFAGAAATVAYGAIMGTKEDDNEKTKKR